LAHKDPGLRRRLEDTCWIVDLIELRNDRGLTQKQVADLAGTSQPAIARLENGKQEPTLGFLRRVVEALGGRLEVRIRPATAVAEPESEECPPADAGDRARQRAA
ncbi:MAG TPA: helix-turn-helix domain-containing protein, partial [Anaerolineae bacterium]|nr:helix-turn-helix domain-containing protein [Anaerolineae bacterium]